MVDTSGPGFRDLGCAFRGARCELRVSILVFKFYSYRPRRRPRNRKRKFVKHYSIRLEDEDDLDEELIRIDLTGHRPQATIQKVNND
jgi:hypothetical protein